MSGQGTKPKNPIGKVLKHLLRKEYGAPAQKQENK
jgi:hypothetical protein